MPHVERAIFTAAPHRGTSFASSAEQHRTVGRNRSVDPRDLEVARSALAFASVRSSRGAAATGRSKTPTMASFLISAHISRARYPRRRSLPGIACSRRRGRSSRSGGSCMRISSRSISVGGFARRRGRRSDGGAAGCFSRRRRLGEIDKVSETFERSARALKFIRYKLRIECYGSLGRVGAFLRLVRDGWK
ncbi:hypothetical protein QFZ89_006051 [Paraburkholderia youngii]